jgi:transposase InsO family protein
VVQKNHSKPQKKKFQQELKQKPTTSFKKGKKQNKEKENCFTCAKPGHYARECPDAKWKPSPPTKKSANTVETEVGSSGYGNLLPSTFSVCHSPDWWVDTGANIYVCADISLFSVYQAGRAGSLLMGNGARAAVRCVGSVDLKLTSRKTVQLKNMHHVPSIKKNLISGSLLCRDGYKLVFESNKCVVSKYDTFVGKDYESERLFRLSLVDTCFKSTNHVASNVETNIWHSRLCLVNFGCMSCLAGLNLIPKFDVIKSSKCHVCVEAKQPHKPHKAAMASELVPLELIHSNVCEMNGILTKGGKRYFITFIDDCTKFCYVYLMKTKDEALYYFKIYKAEVENQIENKVKQLRSDHGGEYFSNNFSEFCVVHGIIHERTPPYSP